MERFRFIPRRLLQAIPVVFGVTVIVFFLIHLLPGDPAQAAMGEHATAAGVAALHQKWGLDKPIWTQYVMFLDRLIHGDLGDSLFYRLPVTTLVIERIPVTLFLVVYSVVLAVAISVPLAAFAAVRPGAIRDHVVRAVPLVGLGMPQFWVGIMLILLLAVRIKIFPVGNYGNGALEHLWYLFLPSLTLAIAMAPIIIRSLRASMISVLSADFVATARSKGLPKRAVLFRHVLRNSAIPTVTVIGVNLGYLVGGTLVVEKVFGLPGLGGLMVNSIFNRDFPVVQGAALVLALFVVLIGLVTDIVYTILDPRVRFR